MQWDKFTELAKLHNACRTEEDQLKFNQFVVENIELIDETAVSVVVENIELTEEFMGKYPDYRKTVYDRFVKLDSSKMGLRDGIRFEMFKVMYEEKYCPKDENL
jgi:hypothetical protein